jgi:hypothetical protein
MMRHLGLLLLALLAVPAVVLAKDGYKPGDIINGINGVHAIAGALGLSILGLLGIITSMRKAIKEVTEFFTILHQKVQDPELKKEANEALSAIADVIEKIPLGFLKGKAAELRALMLK